MKKIIFFILGIIIGSIITVLVFNIEKQSNENKGYVCSYYSNELQKVSYLDASSEIEFHQDNEDYFFNIKLNLNDNIDFSGYSDNQVMFASVSFDGEVPFSVLESNKKYIQIPLLDGKLPKEYSFSISSKDDAFKDNDLIILNSFLEGKEDELVVSINLFDPEGIIIQVSNIYISK